MTEKLIKSGSDVKKLRDHLIKTGDHDILDNRRKVRDRRMDPELDVLGQVIGDRYSKVYRPVQTEEPNDEGQRVKAILVTNTPELEIISRSPRQPIINKAQDLEDALKAVLNDLYPVERSEDELDALLFDDFSVICIEKTQSTALAPYANRKALEAYAEAPPADETEEPGEDAAEEAGETPAEEASEEDSEDTTEGTSGEEADEDASGEPSKGALEHYAEAYRKLQDHDLAYKQVTQEAIEEEGFLYESRTIDRAVFWHREDKPGEVSIGMEDGNAELSPLLAVLEAAGYEVDEESGRFILTTGKKSTGRAALGSSIMPRDKGDVDVGTEESSVRYTRLATRDQIVILIEHMKGATDDDPGAFIECEHPLEGVSSGYYITPGNTKARGNPDERYQPVMLGMLAMAEVTNGLDSVMYAMALAEGTRDEFQTPPNPGPGAVPYDATQEPKALISRDGDAPPLLEGAIQRAETTGAPLTELRQQLDKQTERYRSKEYLSDIASNDQSGIAKARGDAAYLSTRAPIQLRRATTRRRILSDLLAMWKDGEDTQYIADLPSGARRMGEGIRTATSRQITPEMAGLPVDIRVTIGAETPETQWAREQAERQNVLNGVYGMTTARQNMRIDDPDYEVTQMAIDNLVTSMIGTNQAPGWLVTFCTEQVKARVAQQFNATYPAPPATAPMAVPPGGLPPEPEPGPGAPGPVVANPPVQNNEGGTPVVAGASPQAVQ